MRAAVQGESRLKSMPNNTAIMISFAACFAIYLSAKGSGTNGLATSIRVLIEECAGVLERIGTITPHRNGTSRLYARHLRYIVGSQLGRQSDPTQTQPLSYPTEQSIHFGPQTQPPIFQQGQLPMGPAPMADLLQFSAMSDDQINEAINNAGDELVMSLPDFHMDDSTGLDWLNWFNIDVNS